MSGRSGRSDRTTGAYREYKGSGPVGRLPIPGMIPKFKIGLRQALTGGKHPTKSGPGRR